MCRYRSACDFKLAENAKFAGPSDRRGYFLSGSGKHPSITGPCDRLIVHCSPFLPHACAKLHLQWVCQKASGSAKNLVSAGPVVWHIKKSFRILWTCDIFFNRIRCFCDYFRPADRHGYRACHWWDICHLGWGCDRVTPSIWFPAI